MYLQFVLQARGTGAKCNYTKHTVIEWNCYTTYKISILCMTMKCWRKEGWKEDRRKEDRLKKKIWLNASCLIIIVLLIWGRVMRMQTWKGEIFSRKKSCFFACFIFYSSYLDKSELKSSILVPCFYYHYQPLRSVNLTGPVPWNHIHCMGYSRK